MKTFVKIMMPVARSFIHELSDMTLKEIRGRYLFAYFLTDGASQIIMREIGEPSNRIHLSLGGALLYFKNNASYDTVNSIITRINTLYKEISTSLELTFNFEQFTKENIGLSFLNVHKFNFDKELARLHYNSIQKKSSNITPHDCIGIAEKIAKYGKIQFLDLFKSYNASELRYKQILDITLQCKDHGFRRSEDVTGRKLSTFSENEYKYIRLDISQMGKSIIVNPSYNKLGLKELIGLCKIYDELFRIKLYDVVGGNTFRHTYVLHSACDDAVLVCKSNEFRPLIKILRELFSPYPALKVFCGVCEINSNIPGNLLSLKARENMQPLDKV